MKVIFLDIDGVLNHEQFYIKRTESPKTGTDEFQSYPLSEFDPESVANLNYITEQTGAKLIISSSWRFDPDILNILKAVGITGEVIGCTPDLSSVYNTTLCRGKEIDIVLNKRPEITRYVILDDDSDIEPHQMPYFIKTDAYYDGLNRELADKAISILNSVKDC